MITGARRDDPDRDEPEGRPAPPRRARDDPPDGPGNGKAPSNPPRGHRHDAKDPSTPQPTTKHRESPTAATRARPTAYYRFARATESSERNRTTDAHPPEREPKREPTAQRAHPRAEEPGTQRDARGTRPQRTGTNHDPTTHQPGKPSGTGPNRTRPSMKEMTFGSDLRLNFSFFTD